MLIRYLAKCPVLHQLITKNAFQKQQKEKQYIKKKRHTHTLDRHNLLYIVLTHLLLDYMLAPVFKIALQQ